MPLPEIGQTPPDFTLTANDGGATYRLVSLAPQAPTLVAFFKLSCATSKLTLPIIERLHQHYPALQVLGVSQDDTADTAAMAAHARITFPIVRDDGWHVSAAYDLFTVPTVFLLDTQGAVRHINMGWNKEHYLALSDEIAGLLSASPVPLLTETDQVPAFKPG
ncbi:MAG: TlpA family protein disulfide reductase [Chloroflexi bacterium]|nr:TlpA family protein disulfide reductase [Chloroflexota bacterium]